MEGHWVFILVANMSSIHKGSEDTVGSTELYLIYNITDERCYWWEIFELFQRRTHPVSAGNRGISSACAGMRLAKWRNSLIWCFCHTDELWWARNRSVGDEPYEPIPLFSQALVHRIDTPSKAFLFTLWTSYQGFFVCVELIVAKRISSKAKISPFVHLFCVGCALSSLVCWSRLKANRLGRVPHSTKRAANACQSQNWRINLVISPFSSLATTNFQMQHSIYNGEDRQRASPYAPAKGALREKV